MDILISSYTLFYVQEHATSNKLVNIIFQETKNDYNSLNIVNKNRF